MEDTVVAEEVTGLALNCTAGDAGLHAAAAAGNDDDDDDEGCDVSSKHTRLGRRTDTSPSPLTPTWKNHLSYPQLWKENLTRRAKSGKKLLRIQLHIFWATSDIYGTKVLT